MIDSGVCVTIDAQACNLKMFTCSLSSVGFEANFEHAQDLSVICCDYTPAKAFNALVE
jgi:hypothetical protein